MLKSDKVRVEQRIKEALNEIDFLKKRIIFHLLVFFSNEKELNNKDL